MKDLPDKALDQIAAYFQALSEPTRLTILNLLREQERTVGELAQLSGCLLWAIPELTKSNWNQIWLLPTALILTSFGWWENYVDKHSPIGMLSTFYQIKWHKSSIIISLLVLGFRICQIFGQNQGEDEVHPLFLLHLHQCLESARLLQHHGVGRTLHRW